MATVLDTATLAQVGGVLVGGGATILATQFLKSKYIPVQFEKYPRWTAGVISLVAAIITEWHAGIRLDFSNLPALGAVFVGTLWVAVSVYNHIRGGVKTA